VYRILAVTLAFITAPLWLPLMLYIAVTYDWTDTVPKQEDL
jgi:hypothetical protein